jgi:hypothetical protein
MEDGEKQKQIKTPAPKKCRGSMLKILYETSFILKAHSFGNYFVSNNLKN